MFDPAAPTTDLPQPPREPFVVDEAPSPTSEPVAAPQEAVQAVSMPTKVTVTVARQLDERVRVMEDRLQSFISELNKLGITDPEAVEPGLREHYVDALRGSHDLLHRTGLLREKTHYVRNTMETL